MINKFHFKIEITAVVKTARNQKDHFRMMEGRCEIYQKKEVFGSHCIYTPPKTWSVSVSSINSWKFPWSFYFLDCLNNMDLPF